MFSLKKSIFSLIIALSAFSFSGCCDKAKEETTKEDNKVETIETKKIIGQTGGTIKDKPDDSFYTIDIPQGALNSDVEISVEFDSVEEGVVETGKSPSFGFLGDFTFEPSGTVFNKDIDVTTKLATTPKNSEISVFCYCEETDVWDYVTNATVSNGNASFKINHFSEYKILDLSPEMLAKHTSLVREAKANGRSDAWVTEKYRDYLVNDCHVLDIYSEVGGYYYEPIGLQFSAEYRLADGTEGNSDELMYAEGSDGKVGNRLGMAQFASLTTSSYEYYKKKNDPAYEKQELTYVLVTVTLDMIKPNIDLTAPKQNLAKGETVRVDVNCHYVNPDNPFYPDFPLPNYPLTLPYDLQHFTYSTKEITTDSSGKASFTVTAKDEGSESLKVMFYVSGVFGEYASQFMKFTCGGGHSISGHIIQEYDFSFYAAGTDHLTYVSPGTAKLTFEYDFSGNIDEENKGSVQFTNATAKMEGTAAIAKNSDATGRYNFFQNVNSVDCSSPTFNFNASVDNENKCTLNLNGNSATIMTVNGEGYMSGTGETIGVRLILTLSASDTLLLPFNLEEGTQTLESASLKDQFGGKSIWWGDTYSFDDTAVVISSSYKTTQTITVA